MATQEGVPLEHDSAAQLKELIGSNTIPVWLNPERFLDESFDAEGVVLDLRRYVPLATLHNELNDYLGLLKAKLVEVINEDYSDYVSLSSRLVNVDGSVLRMRKPLLELKDKLTVVQESVKTELTALSQGLKRRKEVATARSLLELLQELAHVASKVEKLLAEVDAVDDASLTDLDAHARLLERVAGEVSRLSFQAHRGKDLAFVRAMESRAAGYRSALEARLGGALTMALTATPVATAAALHLLHAYVELGDAAPAEATLRRVVVAPLVAKAVAEHKASAPARARDGDSLSRLLSGILGSVRTEVGALLSSSLEPGGTLRIFDFLGNVVLDEVQSVLAAELPGVFSPGVPPAFHANYLAAMAFLGQLEALCQGLTALDRLRGSAAYGAFLRRWNLSVYFSLLYQDIAGRLEDAAGSASTAGGLAPLTTPGQDGVRLPLSASLLDCLARACSPATFLPPLADRTLKLALQMVARYRAWMRAALAARAAGPPPAPPRPTSPAHGGGDDGGLGASSGGGYGGSGADPRAPPVPSWVASVPTEDLAVLQQDVLRVADHVSSALHAAVVELLSSKGLGNDAVAAAGASLESAASGLRDTADAFTVVMAAELGERCVAVVRQLKGITATYRMTTKGPPTRHSHYVTGVLTPLRTVLESERLRGAAPGGGLALAAAVADAVSVSYTALAEELLTTVRKTEESLKRLKKKEAADGAGGGEAAMSDSDKIGLQLQLDVAEYGAQLASLGLAPDAMPTFQRLQEAVNAKAPKA